ncbi:hypothetical protein [Haloechinothrix aidingensis]|uniref:hypothetical protein n=1 Tax=Haloechinothrix aidingensis TaxID=2752311 RepID=UPI0015DDA074|nr:hypothetical protein [Haloechinothrix aidingensis]
MTDRHGLLPKQTLHIGDHWEWNVVSATLAGTHPYWISAAPAAQERISAPRRLGVTEVADLTAAGDHVRILCVPEDR